MDRLRARVEQLETRFIQRQDAALAAAHQRTNDFAATLNGWFWETDAENRFTYLSPNVETITGLTPEWHYGKTRRDLGVPAFVPEAKWADHLATIEARQPFADFVFLREGAKGDTWLNVSGTPFFDHTGTFQGYRGTGADVSAEVEAKDHTSNLMQAIEHKNRLLETTLHTIPDGVQVVDQDLKLVAWNDQLFEVMDMDQSAILSADNPGKAFFQALARQSDYGENDLDALIASQEAYAVAGEHFVNVRQLASGKWIECRGSPVAGGRFLALYRDITEPRQMMARLEQQASVDPLTGAMNRRKLMSVADAEFRRASRYDRPMSLVVLDIDHFKAVNDQFGHAAGDQALKKFVEICNAGLRDTDAIGRVGGEEFVLMLPETDTDGAMMVAERLRQNIQNLVLQTDTAEFHFTTSGGVAGISFADSSVSDIIKAADAALYAAKRAGRNRIYSSASSRGGKTGATTASDLVFNTPAE